MELAITELFWPQRHGITKSTTQNIQGHFLVYNTLQPDELYNGSYKDIVDGLLEEQRECMFKFSCGLGGLLPDDITKCILEEYPVTKMYSREDFHQPELIRISELKGGEQVAIKQTFWLKILQRKCRKYLNRLNRV